MEQMGSPAEPYCRVRSSLLADGDAHISPISRICVASAPRPLIGCLWSLPLLSPLLTASSISSSLPLLILFFGCFLRSPSRSDPAVPLLCYLRYPGPPTTIVLVFPFSFCIPYTLLVLYGLYLFSVHINYSSYPILFFTYLNSSSYALLLHTP